MARIYREDYQKKGATQKATPTVYMGVSCKGLAEDEVTYRQGKSQ